MIRSHNAGGTSEDGDRAAAIVGRERELALLRDLLATMLAGEGRVVLIGGEAGIGKTTLVDELKREAVALGAAVLTGHCFDLTMTPPYGPWRDAFRDLPSRGDPDLPIALATTASVDEDPGQPPMIEQVYDLLVSLSADQPVVIVLEDLHWSDPASLDLLRVLARRLAERPALFVVTYRDAELTRHHPLFVMLPLLVREANARRLDLRRLGVDDVRALVAGRYQLPVADETRLVGHLQAQADGNPLFAGELLRTLEDEGFLTLTASGWTLGAIDRAPVPPLVAQAIESRLTRLREDERRLLQIAAAIGHVVPVDLWRSIGGADEEQLFALIERVVEAHLLEATDDPGSLRFVHALIREAVYAGVLPVRRRNWHRQIAEALLDQPRPDPDAVALHFRQAGDERAAGWHIEAGERALRLYAWLTAADRFEEAARLLEGSAESERGRGWLLYRAGRLYRFSNPDRSLALLDDAERIAVSVADPILGAFARFDHQLPLDHLNRKAEAMVALESGLAALLDITEEQARQSGVEPAWVADVPSSAATIAQDTYAAIRSRQGQFTVQLANFGRLKDAVAVGEGFLASSLVGDGRVDPVSVADALDGLAAAWAEFGQPERARQTFERARSMGRKAGHNIGLGATIMRELFFFVEPYVADDVAYRQQLASEAEALFRDIAGVSPAGLSVRAAWVPVWYLEGQWDDLLREAEDERRTASPVYAARVARHQGRPGDAWALIRMVYPASPGRGGSATLLTVPFWDLAGALALDEGNLELARTWLEAFDQDIGQTGRTWGKAESRLLWARHAALAGNAAEARMHADAALAHAREPRQPLALVAVHRFLGRLAVAAGSYREAEASLQESLALADACAVPFERALTLLELAELSVADGRADVARALADEIHSVCLPLRAEPTLRRVDELLATLAGAVGRNVAPAGLTARELDVLRLVAQGLTDAEVAERLFVARRTVNTHLTSIYTKLNVSSRAAATRFAVEQGLTSPATAGLSNREIEVLRLLVDGRSNKEIADALFISPNTVTNHVANIMNKIGLESRTAVATWAVRQGVV
jgi:DNA-binding CsgD family transcriptional regulator/tetratricopeptide (TPR) repeat protein